MKIDYDIFNCDNKVVRRIARTSRLVQAIAQGNERADRVKEYEVELKKLGRQLYVDGFDATSEEIADAWKAAQEKRESKELPHTIEVLSGVLKEKLMADVIYNRAKQGFLQGDFNLGTDDVTVALVTSTYVVNIDTHDDFADITNQLSGTGYTADGEDLTSEAVTVDDTDDEGVFDAADVPWTSIDAGTADAAILYIDTGTDATSLLIAYIDSGGFPIVTNGGDLTIAWNAEGILNLN